MNAPSHGIDLTCRTEALSLSDISRAFGLSRSSAQKWHKTPVQSATGHKAALPPALHAVAQAIGVRLGPDVLEGPRPRYPVEVVLALGQALGYLDRHGHLIKENQGKGRGRWLPAVPTIDPATRRERHYVNHLAAALGVTNEAVEMGLSRKAHSYVQPDGTDEMGRSFWWAPTVEHLVERARTGPAGRRIRLYGGRHTHSAAPGRRSFRTGCGKIIGRSDHWMPDTAVVTCPACRKAEAAG
ncbi:hypothetical protein [Streptomyces marianii]|uniref:hypothetical protein n=1 Tax=Streptomyces marianii TaxID=1817406 RepID=UPI0018F8C905|nr:hypothetical protein [Streptomyces marianii]